MVCMFAPVGLFTRHDLGIALSILPVTYCRCVWVVHQQQGGDLTVIQLTQQVVLKLAALASC